MKKYLKEIIILIFQSFMFYLFPLFAGPTDAIGMVFLIWVSTIILGILISVISNKKIKFLYPIIVAIVFIPSVFIYYNKSALIHSIWYFISFSIGILIGEILNLLINKFKNN